VAPHVAFHHLASDFEAESQRKERAGDSLLSQQRLAALCLVWVTITGCRQERVNLARPSYPESRNLAGIIDPESKQEV
jgi:hypothetical protein